MPCDPEKLAVLASIYAEWIQNLSEEDRAKREKMQADFIKDPTMWETFMEEMFTAADANGDGLLDQAEYVEYARNAIEQSVVRHNRIGPSFDEARHQLEYECYNTMTPGVEGISIADLKAAGGELARASMALLGGPRKPASFDLEKMEQLAQVHIAFLQGLDEATLQRRKQANERWTTHAAELMAEFNAKFTEADANGDGRLNLEEYLTYSRLATALYQGDHGSICPDYDEERARLEYELFGSWNPEAEGVDFAEMTKANMAMMARVTEVVGNI